MVALDVEAINTRLQAKAGGRCAIVAQDNEEMKVLFDKFVRPVCGDCLCVHRGTKLWPEAVGWNLMQQ